VNDDSVTPRLHLQLDDRSGVPVYRQMMDQIKYYVAGGTLRPGDQIPSIRELAAALTVNPTTVVKAYTELEREGVIEKRHGKGAFISAASVQLTQAEQETAIRRSAKHLAVEATQLQVPSPKVIHVVSEELDALDAVRTATKAPEKASESASISQQ
jgi:GntR family transcriptional regulator